VSSETFSGRVALVTGGSGGIGRQLALRLADAGAAVAVCYSASPEPAEAVARAIADGGGRAVALRGDLALPGTAAELVAAAEEALGPVDVLVANAGTAPRQTLDEITVDDWDRVLAVNLRAPFQLAQSAVPGMRERGWGRILFVSSVAAFIGGVIGPHYAASKSGLHGLTYFLAGRLAKDGITVNTIAPALVEDTGMLPGTPDELRSMIPVGRLGRPEEVADLAVALLGNAYLTGKVVLLDGGIHPR
jgi:3-oxoacyl-[acyl-carrier protein] reductase